MTGAKPKSLRRRLLRVARIASGSTLLVLGVIGLFLPVLQGVALILAGLAVLATELPWARRWLRAGRDWLRRLTGRGKRESEASDEQGGGPTG